MSWGGPAAGYNGAMSRIGLVLGAGGIVGGAFHEGVLRAITDATGWDPRDAAIIVGTSVGSHAGAMLRAGSSTSGEAPAGGRTQPAETAPQARRYAPASPRMVVRGLTRPGSVRVGAMLAGMLPAGQTSFAGAAAQIDRLHRNGWPDQPLWLPAVRLRDGALVVFGREGSPPASVGQAVAASCAVPGYFSPVTIDGERYIDGGVHSATNADLLAGADLDLVLVSSPMGAARGAMSVTAHLQGRGYMRFRLAAEARAVRRSGIDLVAFSPTADDLPIMGWNALSGARRNEIMERAYESAARRLRDARWREALAAL